MSHTLNALVWIVAILLASLAAWGVGIEGGPGGALLSGFAVLVFSLIVGGSLVSLVGAKRSSECQLAPSRARPS